MPLQIRRNETALKYCIKVKNDSKHPARKIIEETGLIFKRKQYTLQTETKEFLKITPNFLPIRANMKQPPWKRKVRNICSKVQDMLNSNKNLPKEMWSTILNNHITVCHQTKIACYADGSKKQDGRSGAAFIFDDGFERSYRLSNNTSSSAAEYTAIELALNFS